MSIESIKAEMDYRTKVRISETTNRAMQTFRTLLSEIECMDDTELEVFQNAILSYGMHSVVPQRQAFAAAVHDATIHFLDHNKV